MFPCQLLPHLYSTVFYLNSVLHFPVSEQLSNLLSPSSSLEHYRQLSSSFPLKFLSVCTLLLTTMLTCFFLSWYSIMYIIFHPNQNSCLDTVPMNSCQDIFATTFCLHIYFSLSPGSTVHTAPWPPSGSISRSLYPYLFFPSL
jgi:hypothetical protein